MKRLYNAALEIACDTLSLAKGKPLQHAGIVTYCGISSNIALHFNRRFLAPVKDVSVLTINNVFYCSDQVRIMGECYLELTDGKSFETVFWFYITQEVKDDQQTS